MLRPEYDRILQRIRSSKVVYIDETGMKVDGENNWIWVFVTEDSILFALRKSRGAKVLEEVLGDYDGTIVCDGWKAYASFSSRLQRCWSLILREADDSAPRGCTRDGGRPPGAGLQEQAPNHLKLHV